MEIETLVECGIPSIFSSSEDSPAGKEDWGLPIHRSLVTLSVGVSIPSPSGSSNSLLICWGKDHIVSFAFCDHSNTSISTAPSSGWESITLDDIDVLDPPVARSDFITSLDMLDLQFEDSSNQILHVLFIGLSDGRVVGISIPDGHSLFFLSRSTSGKVRKLRLQTPSEVDRRGLQNRDSIPSSRVHARNVDLLVLFECAEILIISLDSAIYTWKNNPSECFDCDDPHVFAMIAPSLWLLDCSNIFDSDEDLADCCYGSPSVSSMPSAFFQSDFLSSPIEGAHNQVATPADTTISSFFRTCLILVGCSPFLCVVDVDRVAQRHRNETEGSQDMDTHQGWPGIYSSTEKPKSELVSLPSSQSMEGSHISSTSSASSSFVSVVKNAVVHSLFSWLGSADSNHPTVQGDAEDSDIFVPRDDMTSNLSYSYDSLSSLHAEKVLPADIIGRIDDLGRRGNNISIDPLRGTICVVTDDLNRSVVVDLRRPCHILSILRGTRDSDAFFSLATVPSHCPASTSHSSQSVHCSLSSLGLLLCSRRRGTLEFFTGFVDPFSSKRDCATVVHRSSQIQPVSLSAFVSSQMFFENRLSQLSSSGSRGVFYLFESERGIVRRVNILCRSRRSCDLLHTACPSSDVLSCDANLLGSSYTDEEAYERSLRAILSTIHQFAWKSTESCDSERISNPLDFFLSSVSQLNDPLALLRIAELAVYIMKDVGLISKFLRCCCDQIEQLRLAYVVESEDLDLFDDTNSNPSCSSRMLEYSSRIEEHLLGSFRLHSSESISIPLIRIPHTTSFALSDSYLSERDHDIIVSCCQGFLQKPFYHGDRHPHFVSIDPGWVLKVSLLFVRTVQAYRAMEALAVSSSIASSASFSTYGLVDNPADAFSVRPFLNVSSLPEESDDFLSENVRADDSEFVAMESNGSFSSPSSSTISFWMTGLDHDVILHDPIVLMRPRSLTHTSISSYPCRYLFQSSLFYDLGDDIAFRLHSSVLKILASDLLRLQESSSNHRQVIDGRIEERSNARNVDILSWTEFVGCLRIDSTAVLPIPFTSPSKRVSTLTHGVGLAKDVSVEQLVRLAGALFSTTRVGGWEGAAEIFRMIGISAKESRYLYAIWLLHLPFHELVSLDFEIGVRGILSLMELSRMEHEYEDCSCQVLSDIVEAALLFPVRPLFRLALLVQLCDWSLWYGSSSSLADDPSNIDLFSFSSRRALSVILVQGFLPKDTVLASDLQEGLSAGERLARGVVSGQLDFSLLEQSGLILSLCTKVTSSDGYQEVVFLEQVGFHIVLRCAIGLFSSSGLTSSSGGGSASNNVIPEVCPGLSAYEIAEKHVNVDPQLSSVLALTIWKFCLESSLSLPFFSNILRLTSTKSSNLIVWVLEKLYEDPLPLDDLEQALMKYPLPDSSLVDCIAMYNSLVEEGQFQIYPFDALSYLVSCCRLLRVAADSQLWIADSENSFPSSVGKVLDSTARRQDRSSTNRRVRFQDEVTGSDNTSTDQHMPESEDPFESPLRRNDFASSPCLLPSNEDSTSSSSHLLFIDGCTSSSSHTFVRLCCEFLASALVILSKKANQSSSMDQSYSVLPFSRSDIPLLDEKLNLLSLSSSLSSDRLLYSAFFSEFVRSWSFVDPRFMESVFHSGEEILLRSQSSTSIFDAHITVPYSWTKLEGARSSLLHALEFESDDAVALEREESLWRLRRSYGRSREECTIDVAQCYLIALVHIVCVLVLVSSDEFFPEEESVSSSDQQNSGSYPPGCPDDETPTVRNREDRSRDTEFCSHRGHQIRRAVLSRRGIRRQRRQASFITGLSSRLSTQSFDHLSCYISRLEHSSVYRSRILKEISSFISCSIDPNPIPHISRLYSSRLSHIHPLTSSYHLEIPLLSCSRIEFIVEKVRTLLSEESCESISSYSSYVDSEDLHLVEELFRVFSQERFLRSSEVSKMRLLRP